MAYKAVLLAPMRLLVNNGQYACISGIRSQCVHALKGYRQVGTTYILYVESPMVMS